MDPFSIPERLEPVAPSEPARRQGFSSDQRRRRNQEPRLPEVPDEDSDVSPDGEDLHKIDELA